MSGSSSWPTSANLKSTSLMLTENNKKNTRKSSVCKSRNGVRKKLNKKRKRKNATSNSWKRQESRLTRIECRQHNVPRRD